MLGRFPAWMRVLRVVSLVSGVALVALTLLTAGLSEHQRSLEHLDQELLSSAEAQSDALDGYFARSRAIVLLTAQNPAFRALYEGPRAQAGRHLEQVDAALRYLERLYPDSIGEACLIDRSGVERARVTREQVADRGDLSGDETGNAFFAPTFAARPGDVFQARPYVSEDTHEWVISNSTPIPTSGRRSRAVVHFEVTLESFRRAAAMADRRSFTRIVDGTTGRVIIDSRMTQSATRIGPRAAPGLLGALRRLPSGPESGALLSLAEGRSAVHALGSMPGNANHWYVVVTPRSTIDAGGWRLGARSLALLAVAMIVLGIALVSFWLSAQTLRRAALTDVLTGLPNRALLRDRLQQAVLQARRAGTGVGVLVLDLDRFKEINDTLGHHQGDLLLQKVAVQLQAAVRAGDTVARLGGDEFAVLIPELRDPLVAIALADRIGTALTRPVILDGVEVDVAASIGIALYPEHGEEIDTLVQRADVAMYAAKSARRRYTVYTAELDPHTAHRLALVSELRRAIDARQLHLHYQPKYELVGGRICGVEALVRWDHPERGPIPPSEFVPLAEHTGLIRPMTDWVLDEALAQVARWQARGHVVPVAVNLSPRSLLDAELPDQVAGLLDRHGLSPRMLCLEITESVIMEDPDRALAGLRTLHEMGIRLAIDDFGTGYSSLAYLKQLPVAELKIDRSFVMNMAASEDDAIIVRSTIDLGHNLGLEVVAEGVEDERTLAILTGLACDAAQGYHLSRPLPADAVTAMLGAPTGESPSPSTAAL
jgi:diguanylate cyclase (GGDEF)-like protein